MPSLIAGDRDSPRRVLNSTIASRSSHRKGHGSSGNSHGAGEDYKMSRFPMPLGDHNSHLSVSNGMKRNHKILTEDEVAAGKTTRWLELEISGPVRHLSQDLWKFRHLTALFLNENALTRIPPEISRLDNLQLLDLSHNRLRSLPTEMGEMVSLMHLYLNFNQLRVLPYELGKLFRLNTLGLHGNPLNPEIARLYNKVNGTSRLQQYLLDHLSGWF